MAIRLRGTGLLLVSVLTLLGGCTKGTSDLQAYINEVKSRPGAPLEQIPPMKTFETFEYNAQELRDPFAPDQSEQEETAVASTSGPRPDANRRKEFLEQFPLDSLDMVGTLGAGDDVWGLIKDPDGLVHRVKPDNYMGQNHGRIVSVTDDRVDVIELIPNGLGGWIERQASIALDE